MAWGNYEFVKHYYQGKGAAKTLVDIGLADSVWKTIGSSVIDRPGGLKDQIRKATKDGNFTYEFENSYDFGSVIFSLGSAKVSGGFKGVGSGGKAAGKIKIEFSDSFTDPLSVIELLYGSSSSSDVPAWLKEAAELGGDAYAITGSWSVDYSY